MVKNRLAEGKITVSIGCCVNPMDYSLIPRKLELFSLTIPPRFHLLSISQSPNSKGVQAV